MLLSGVLVNLELMYLDNLESSMYSETIANGVAALEYPRNAL